MAKLPQVRSMTEKNFTIEYHQVKVQNEKPITHFHPNYQIHYLLKGKLNYVIDNRKYTVQQGDLLFINKYDVFQTVSSDDSPTFERIVIHFTDGRIQPMLLLQTDKVLPFNRLSRFIRFTEEEQRSIEPLLFKMLEEDQKQNEYYEFTLQASFIQLLVQLRRFEEKNLEWSKSSHPMYRKISEITAYLGGRFEQEFHLNEIAQKFYISPSYLSRVFKMLTGFYMSEYVRILRIRESQRLLGETNEKVQDIAAKVGFREISHFNKTFKNITGHTPLTYRKKIRRNHSVHPEVVR
ncbi:AraC family transcriptional regulator [Marinicrinis lubricantis]|uniref:AraC family transcriptional regulator n=1 Tax=Marinicrinis lubricantis TaxID=2086470 RepID=A0ABW1ISU9_9BACL